MFHHCCYFTVMDKLILIVIVLVICPAFVFAYNDCSPTVLAELQIIQDFKTHCLTNTSMPSSNGESVSKDFCTNINCTKYIESTREFGSPNCTFKNESAATLNSEARTLLESYNRVCGSNATQPCSTVIVHNMDFLAIESQWNYAKCTSFAKPCALRKHESVPISWCSIQACQDFVVSAQPMSNPECAKHNATINARIEHTQHLFDSFIRVCEAHIPDQLDSSYGVFNSNAASISIYSSLSLFMIALIIA